MTRRSATSLLPALVCMALVPALSASVSEGVDRDLPSTDTLTLQALLARHTEATGGRPALDSLRSLDVAFVVIEPRFALEGRYRATRDGRVRVDVFAGDDTVYSEGIDAKGAWKREPPDRTVEPLSDEGAAALRHGITFNLTPLHRYPDRGHELSYEGEETHDGRTFHVIRVTLDDGFRARFFLDPETWLTARRRERRALHPDQDSTGERLETLFREYEEVCGVARATRTYQVDLATGDTVQSTRVLEQRCNLPVEALDLPREAGG